jgi:hypothetical protein
MKTFLLQFFTWWNGQTLGTRFGTWRHGEKVGEDEFGNVYYRSRGGKADAALGHERRWVIYNGLAEASSVPAGCIIPSTSRRRRRVICRAPGRSRIRPT